MYLAVKDMLIPDYELMDSEDGALVYEGHLESSLWSYVDRTRVGHFRFLVYLNSDTPAVKRMMAMDKECEEVAETLIEAGLEDVKSCLLISRIEVFPRYRLDGMGSEAVKTILEFGKRMGVETAALQAWNYLDKTATRSHPKLLAFWEKNGFQPCPTQGTMVTMTQELL